MTKRTYYSVRTGKHSTKGRIDFELLRDLFKDLYFEFANKGHFQQALGFSCVDREFIPGLAGDNVSAYVLRKLKKRKIWPVHVFADHYSEDDLFDLVEFLFDHAAKGVKGTFHSFNDCGYHYDTFDRAAGQDEFRDGVTELLCDYAVGFELSPAGEILTLPQVGLDGLYSAELPPFDKDNVEARVSAAVLKFRRRGSSLDDRRDAIRDLADVLEFLKPQLKETLVHSDESDLFNIANNFGIRHHNTRQKTGYDKSVWFSWMFYYYLATIHACLHLLKRKKKQ
jgi:hypothetical protein